MHNTIVNNIFSVNERTFDELAIQIFKSQYKTNAVYNEWVNAIGVDVTQINNITTIPFLPVSFFKTHHVVCKDRKPEKIFESSGTTGMVNSRHIVNQLDIYESSFIKGFELFYGSPKDYCIIGLLPAYLEREGSSLVFMVDHLIKLSDHNLSGFYLYNYDELNKVLQLLEQAQQKTLLIGVTFALMDFAEQYPMQLNHTTIMETGGMKGRRKEMIREEVHQLLQMQFNTTSIHSEYGMTELLSQAYSDGLGIFKSVPWMKTLVREENDPLSVSRAGKGLINIIDLANIYSCSFIATDDAGTIDYENNSFTVLGRSDNSDIRGCSLLYV